MGVYVLLQIDNDKAYEATAGRMRSVHKVTANSLDMSLLTHTRRWWL